MIYKIEPIKDDFLEKIYKESMNDLNEFYEIDWVFDLPKIILVSDRKAIDLWKQKKTEQWNVGWQEGKTIFILDRNNLEKESNHQYSPETYFALIKHELSHAFYHIKSNHQHKPIWLCEGVAIYTSGQNKFKKKPTKFNKFLEFYDEGGGGVYGESGFVVQMLVEKFGKSKLFELIKKLKNINSKEEFDKVFEDIYGFVPSYEKFNEISCK